MYKRLRRLLWVSRSEPTRLLRSNGAYADDQLGSGHVKSVDVAWCFILSAGDNPPVRAKFDLESLTIFIRHIYQRAQWKFGLDVANVAQEWKPRRTGNGHLFGHLARCVYACEASILEIKVGKIRYTFVRALCAAVAW